MSTDKKTKSPRSFHSGSTSSFTDDRGGDSGKARAGESAAFGGDNVLDTLMPLTVGDNSSPAYAPTSDGDKLRTRAGGDTSPYVPNSAEAYHHGGLASDKFADYP